MDLIADGGGTTGALVGDEVFVTTPGGPVFRDVELAKVRGYLSDYLHTMEELGTADHVETLHVRGVDRNTLQPNLGRN